MSDTRTPQASSSNEHDDAGLWPESVNFGEVIYPPGGTFGPRIQRTLQLVMLHSGSMTVWIDGHPRHATAGTVAVLFPGHEEHFAFAETSETWHSWLHASVPGLSNELRERLQRLPWPLPLSSAMHALTREALHLRTTPLSTVGPMLKALAAQMLWRYIGEGEAWLAGGAGRPAHHAIELAQQFIEAHLSEPLTLEQIAAAVAVSEAHLIRLFRAQLHTTPIAYLWQRRVALGIELLRQTGLSIGTIAERCGFQSRYHFSRRVRQASGCAPMTLRQQSWQR